MHARERGENRDSGRARVVRDGRPERAEKRNRGDRDIGESRDVGEPVHPADRESDSFAKCASRVHPEATGLGDHGGELGHRHRTHQRVEPADQPHEHDERRVPQSRRDRTRQAKNADAHCRPEAKRHAEAESKDAEQRAGLLHQSIAYASGVTSSAAKRRAGLGLAERSLDALIECRRRVPPFLHRQ